MMDNKKLFSNPRWTQNPGPVNTGKKFKITKDMKSWSEEESKKWKETVKKLEKERKGNTTL